MTESEPTVWLSARELADFFVVDVKTIRNWEKRGILPPGYSFGQRCVRWDSNDIIAFIQGHFQPWRPQAINARYHPCDVTQRVRQREAAEAAADDGDPSDE